MFQLKNISLTSSADSIRTTHWLLYVSHRSMLRAGGKFLSITKLSSFFFFFSLSLVTIAFTQRSFGATVVTFTYPCECSACSASQGARMTASNLAEVGPSAADHHLMTNKLCWWAQRVQRTNIEKGQTLNVVTSSASRLVQAPLPLWVQINAVMSHRSTLSSRRGLGVCLRSCLSLWCRGC